MSVFKEIIPDPQTGPLSQDWWADNDFKDLIQALIGLFNVMVSFWPMISINCTALMPLTCWSCTHYSLTFWNPLSNDLLSLTNKRSILVNINTKIQSCHMTQCYMLTFHFAVFWFPKGNYNYVLRQILTQHHIVPAEMTILEHIVANLWWKMYIFNRWEK